MVRKGRWAALAAVVVMVATGCWHDVGSLGGFAGVGGAYANNNRGDVVGFSAIASGRSHAFIRNIHGGEMTDITRDLAADRASLAKTVNEIGMVAGTIGPAGPEAPPSIPFYWWPYDGLIELALPVGMDDAEAMDIDEAGNVLVTARTDGGQAAAFIWNRGTRQYTPVPAEIPGGSVVGFRFDSGGGVVGWVGTSLSDPESSAAVWDARTLAIHVLPKSEPGAKATDRIAGGMVVGEQQRADGSLVAVYWPSTSPTGRPVELTGTEALAVNNAGQIVGTRFNAEKGTYAAVMWEPGRPRLTDLGDKAGGSFVFDVNEAGEAAGWSFDEQGLPTPVWWDPPAADAPNSPVSPAASSPAISSGRAMADGQRVGATAESATTGLLDRYVWAADHLR